MKTYSKEAFEKSHPYVLVQFEVINDSTFSSVVKSFSTKKAADSYNEKHGNKSTEVMTRRKYNKEASLCL